VVRVIKGCRPLCAGSREHIRTGPGAHASGFTISPAPPVSEYATPGQGEWHPEALPTLGARLKLKNGEVELNALPVEKLWKMTSPCSPSTVFPLWSTKRTGTVTIQFNKAAGPQTVGIVPPSMTNSAPVIYETRSDTKKATSSATSSGRPGRPIGIPPNESISP
jgi:hypothetical protein